MKCLKTSTKENSDSVSHRRIILVITATARRMMVLETLLDV
jgi:hypothetical protein